MVDSPTSESEIVGYPIVSARRGMTASERFADIGWTVTQSGCWEWNGRLDRLGYGEFWDGRHVKAHRFALAAGEPLPPVKTLACHRCDNRACVRPDHLYWGTHQDNHNDMVSRGRAKPGGTGEKLTTSDRRFIAEHYQPTRPGPRKEFAWTLRELARHLGVSATTVHQVVREAATLGFGDLR